MPPIFAAPADLPAGGGDYGATDYGTTALDTTDSVTDTDGVAPPGTPAAWP